MQKILLIGMRKRKKIGEDAVEIDKKIKEEIENLWKKQLEKQ